MNKIQTIWLREFYDPGKPPPPPPPKPKPSKSEGMQPAVLRAMRAGIKGPGNIARHVGTSHTSVVRAQRALEYAGLLIVSGSGASKRYRGVVPCEINT